MLRLDFKILLEVRPPYGVVPDTVAVALKLHAANVHGRQGLPGVQERLAVDGDFRDISRGSPAAPLDLLPLLWGAPEVPGLLGSPEGPALDIPEALLALSLAQRHQTPSEGVSHRHIIAQHALGGRGETPHGGEHTARRERRLGGRGGGGPLCRARPRGTCTGHRHTNTRARLSGGTAGGGDGADQAYAYAIAWSHHPGRVPPSGVGSLSSTFPLIT